MINLCPGTLGRHNKARDTTTDLQPRMSLRSTEWRGFDLCLRFRTLLASVRKLLR